MKGEQDSHALDTQINDYLLTASGHLKESKDGIDIRRVSAYGAAAGSALVMMSQAEASVVHNAGTARPVTVTAPGGTGTSYAGFDMDGGGVNDFALFGAQWTTSYFSAGINGTPGGASNSVLGSGDVRKLSSGANIGPNPGTLNWQHASYTNRDVFYNSSGASNWNGTNGETGFAGVRFKIGANTHYGWVKLQVNQHGSLTATEWAYESCPNTAIKAGATNQSLCAQPVPVMGLPALGLMGLAMGGMGLAGLRRRRKDQSKPA